MVADEASLATHGSDVLTELLREAFGWDEVTVIPGPRGATAHIRDVRTPTDRYALKVGRGARPSPDVLAAQVAFIDRARAAGVRVPRLHADSQGRLLVPGPDGTWLRLYDWMETRPVDLRSPETAEAVGVLLARLHRTAPAATREVDGSEADAWYERPPTVADLEAMLIDGAWWAPRLEARIEGLPDLLALATTTDPARPLLCHRDLHPGNVVMDGSGDLVVLDHDDLGPADPARELARALFDWWSDPAPDLAQMGAMYRAYVAADGPARVREAADVTMLVATRLNFLLSQLRIASDPGSAAADRAWADQEIDESLRILPTAAQVTEVLEALRTRAGARWSIT